jgi:hypothetical protein
MRSLSRFLVTAIAALVVLSGCGGPVTAPSHLSLIAVSGAATSHAVTARSLDTPAWGYGRIVAGPPDEFIFTLKRILLEGTFEGGGTVAVIWSDTNGKDITVSSTGAVDLGGLQDISNVPTGTVTGVKITVAARATITGSISNASFANPSNPANPPTVVPALYTKSAKSYDALVQTGGGTLTDFETGPAEPTYVYWNGGDNLVDQEIETPVSCTLQAGDSPTLTILIDVSRALRFYDGLGASGPNPSDLGSAAYFFSHSVLSHSIACFLGGYGSIQGYETVFDVTQHVSSAVDIPGWMTVVYDGSGNIQSAILSGDDDNALTVAKGLVTTSTTTSPGVYTFHYDITEATVTGFTRVSTVGSSSDASWAQPGGSLYGGDARFILRLAL